MIKSRNRERTHKNLIPATATKICSKPTALSSAVSNLREYMPITDEEFQQYCDESDSAKEALSQTASELMQVTVQLRTQNSLLRKQIARLSSPPATPPSEPPTPDGSETTTPPDGNVTNDGDGNPEVEQPPPVDTNRDEPNKIKKMSKRKEK